MKKRFTSSWVSSGTNCAAGSESRLCDCVQNSGASIAVSICGAPRARVLAHGGDNRVRVRSGEDVALVLQRLLPFRLVAQGNARHMKKVRLLLHSARVGQNRPRSSLEQQHVEVR